MSKYKWMKVISISAALLYTAAGSFVYADDSEPTEAGITIQLQDIGTDWKGVQYSCWKIGEVDVNSEPVYVLSDLLDSDIDLNETVVLHHFMQQVTKKAWFTSKTLKQVFTSSSRKTVQSMGQWTRILSVFHILKMA